MGPYGNNESKINLCQNDQRSFARSLVHSHFPTVRHIFLGTKKFREA